MLFTITAKPKPFVKWAGGKRQLLPILTKYIPPKFGTYIEPFVGGGALLFELCPAKAVISDINEELINAYLAIKDAPEKLIKELKKHVNTKEYFYAMRSVDPKTLTPVERASRFIYLNKTCFNGLYRENSKGQFNVPFGRYKNPKICDEENIMAVSTFLNSIDITILCCDYKETCNIAKPGDFIYLDPPYYPLSKTANFTKFHKKDFSTKDQIELAEVFKELDRKGCYVMMTNSNSDFIKNLYQKYKIQEVHANRFINSKADGRGKALTDILITNF